MKPSRGLTIYSALIWMFLLVLTIAGSAQAYTATEEEQLQIDLREARARATDFKAYIKRREAEAIERERFAQESKVIRERDEAQAESARIAYVEKRNSTVPDDAIRERLEKEYDAQQARQELVDNQARIEYLRKKRAVEETIEREASIDPYVEFDLKR